MAIYNYKQFEDAAKKAGLYEQFSEADLLLAQKNPDAGMSILKYKQDYSNATTDAARVLANEGAERIRSEYGGYTGGGDGGSFHLNPISPSSFTSEPAPTYTNKYEKEADKLMQEILNRQEFSYDPASDPKYSAYKKQYAREGRRATEDALGAVAGATGGIPSSYAVTAASQAGNHYAAQAADKIPELEELAYARYLNDLQMKQSDLDMVQNAEERDYARYLDAVAQHNTDRSFKYGQMLDQIESDAAKRTEDLERAILAGEYGDTRYLEEMGIQPKTVEDGTDFAKQLDLAEKLSKLGDSSLLEALLEELGVDTLRDQRESDFRMLKEQHPDGVLTSDKWDVLVSTYGEDKVRAAGFVPESERGPVEPEGVGGDTLTRDEASLYIEAMVYGGESKETIKTAIGDLYSNRVIGHSDALYLIKQYT